MAEEEPVGHLHDAIGEVSPPHAPGTSEVTMMDNSETAMMRAFNGRSNDVTPQAHPRFDPHAKNRHGRTALFEAAKLGHDDIVASLIAMGASVDAADRRGTTPLGICAMNNRHTTASILLKHGADVNARDIEHNTPLHYASSHGAKEMVSLLLRHECDVSCVTLNGKTAVMMSLPSAYNIQVNGQPLSRAFSIFSELLQAGCEMVTMTDQTTPLHEMVDGNDIVGACLLMHYCPSLIDHKDEQGLTALERALTREDRYEMALCLLHYGASSSRLLPSNSTITNSPSWDNHFLPLCSNTFSSLHESSQGGASNAHVFHRLRFLQALLASSFFSPASIGRLVSMGLITPDCMELACAALEQAGKKGGSKDDVDKSKATSTTHNAGTDANTNIAGTQQVLSTTNNNGSSIADFYNQEAADLICLAVWQTLSVRHQCRVLFRRLLGSLLRDKLLRLPLPSCDRDYISLGVNMNSSSPLHVVQLHVAITENDVNRVRELLEAGVDVNSPFMENTPLTRALHLQPSHSDASQLGRVTVRDRDMCRLCGGWVAASYQDVAVILANVPVANTAQDAAAVAQHNSLPLSGGAGDDVEESDVIELLLRHKASLRLKDPLGDTAVDVAVRRGVCVFQRLLTAVVSVTHALARDKSPHSELDEGQSPRSISQVITGLGLKGIAHRSQPSPLEVALLKGDRGTLKQLLYWAATDLAEAGVMKEFRNSSNENNCTIREQGYSDSHKENVAKGTNGKNETILRDSAINDKMRGCTDSVISSAKETVVEVTDDRQTILRDGPDTREPVKNCENESIAPSDVEEAVKPADKPCKKGRSVSELASWVGSTGVTALHCAAVAGLPALTEALLKSESDVNRRDKLGITARQVAESQGAEYLDHHHHLLYTPPHDFWKGLLRTWPKTEPRPFLSHMLLRHHDRSAEGHSDRQRTKEDLCVQKGEWVTNTTVDAQTGVANTTVDAQTGVANTTVDAQTGVANTTVDAQTGVANTTVDAQTGVTNTTVDAQTAVANTTVDAQTGVANTTVDAQTAVTNTTVDAQTGDTNTTDSTQREAGKPCPSGFTNPTDDVTDITDDVTNTFTNTTDDVTNTTDYAQTEPSKQCLSGVRDVSNDHVVRNRPITRHFPLVDYQLTTDILQQHGMHLDKETLDTTA